MPKCERCGAEATVAMNYKIRCELRDRLYCDACAPQAAPHAPFAVQPLPRPPSRPDGKR